MRRASALAALIAVSTAVAAGAAQAEHWTKYTTAADTGVSWSYDSDYTYKDKLTGRLVVMQAISKGTLGPSAPGKPDGVGRVDALDCSKKNLIAVSGYSPSKPLDIKDGWRSDTPKKAEGAENDALFAAVCPAADKAPVK
jgi:hypothetical protein